MTRAPVVLLQPPGTCQAFTRSGSRYPPLGLCQLAAVAGNGMVEVVDADVLDWTAPRTLAEIEGRKPILVGMTVTTATVGLVAEYVDTLSVLGISTVLGGPLATLAPEELLRRCPGSGAVVSGDGEVVFAELARRACAGASFEGMPGVWVPQRPPPVVRSARLPNMDGVPMPRFDGLPVERYWCPDARRTPLVTVATSRGCPHRCRFCGSPALWKRRVLHVPTPTVLDWLEEQVDRHGVREASFVDDCFTLNRARTLELCQGMVSRGLDLSWFCNARATEIDAEVAEVMAAAGCHQVYLGFESGSQRILDAVQKDTKIEDLVHGAQVLESVGISRSVGFIVGLPGETEQTVAETAALANRVKPERIQFSRFTPVHGSTLGEAGASGALAFHSSAEDRVGGWVKRMYAECQGPGWGRASW